MPSRCSIVCSFFFVLAAGSVGGCFWRDDDALFTKMHDECRLSPPIPGCCATDDACQRGVYDDFFARSVNSGEEQACILDAPCKLEDGSVDDQPILLCLASHDDDAFDAVFPRGLPDEECASACNSINADCGDGASCDLDLARACIADDERCIDACR